MKSIYIGKRANIPVRIHFSFLVIIPMIIVHMMVYNWISGLIFTLLLLMIIECIILRELTRYQVINLKIPSSGIIILPLGWLKNISQDYRKDRKMACSVVASSFCLAIFFSIFAALANFFIVPGVPISNVMPHWNIFTLLVWANVILTCLNLIPVFPMDASYLLGMKSNNHYIVIAFLVAFIAVWEYWLFLVAIYILFFGIKNHSQQSQSDDLNAENIVIEPEKIEKFIRLKMIVLICICSAALYFSLLFYHPYPENPEQAQKYLHENPKQSVPIVLDYIQTLPTKLQQDFIYDIEIDKVWPYIMKSIKDDNIYNRRLSMEILNYYASKIRFDREGLLTIIQTLNSKDAEVVRYAASILQKLNNKTEMNASTKKILQNNIAKMNKNLVNQNIEKGNGKSKNERSVNQRAYWKFDENKGESYVKDFSGKKNYAIIRGGRRVSGLGKGYALSLNNENEYLDAGSISKLNLHSAFTVSLWVMLLDAQSHSKFGDPIITTEEGLQGFQLTWDGSKKRFGVMTCNNSVHMTWGKVAKDYDQWYHVVVIIDDINVKLYINGELEVGEKTKGYKTNPQTNFIVGTKESSFSNQHWLRLLVDNIRVYNSILAKNDIINLYNKRH